jgi:hypothetical protein
MLRPFGLLENLRGNEIWNPEATLSRVEAEHYLQAGDYPQAELLFKAAVDQADQHHYSLAMRGRLRMQLAEAQRRQSKLAEAEETARAGLALAVETRDPSLYALLLDTLSEIFFALEKYAAVETVVQEALRAEQNLPSPDPFRIGRRQHRLGMAQYRIGRVEEAIPAIEKAVACHDQAFGPEHEETAKLLSELGQFYRIEGDHASAEKHLKRALYIYEKKQGPESDEAVRNLHLLAGSYEESGQIDAAAALYERALLLKERVLGGSLDDLAEAQFNLAGRYVDWGNYMRARELLQDALGTFKRKKDARLAIAYQALAYVEEFLGRYLEAVAELAHAGKIWESMGSERMVELASNLEHRAELLDLLQERGEALWLREKAKSLGAAGAA